jgi:hypothetical protein
MPFRFSLRSSTSTTGLISDLPRVSTDSSPDFKEKLHGNPGMGRTVVRDSLLSESLPDTRTQR